MTKRQAATRRSEQPTFSMKVWGDLSYAFQVWLCITQETDRIPSIDTIKAVGTGEGPWHTQDTLTFRRLSRTVSLVCDHKKTELQIDLIGFEIHEGGRKTTKWHLVESRLIGDGVVEVWVSRQQGWYRNTPHSPIQHPYDVMCSDPSRYYNAHQQLA